jgi:hypothetical protein
MVVIFPFFFIAFIVDVAIDSDAFITYSPGIGGTDKGKENKN